MALFFRETKATEGSRMRNKYNVWKGKASKEKESGSFD